MYFISKIGGWITVLGIISLVFLSAADEQTAMTVCAIVGGVLSISGLFFGWRAYEWGISPFAAIFMSWAEFMEGQITSAIVWMVRFFFFPFIITTIIFMIAA